MTNEKTNETESRPWGWIGVDLDGTLAHYDGWQGIAHIGAPIPKMVTRVQQWIAKGQVVKIFTARVGGAEDSSLAQIYINNWCHRHIGIVLPITAKKDMAMVELWDDRAVQVQTNTGNRVDGLP